MVHDVHVHVGHVVYVHEHIVHVVHVHVEYEHVVHLLGGRWARHWSLQQVLWSWLQCPRCYHWLAKRATQRVIIATPSACLRKLKTRA